jgi:NAD(P)-dependent dehydrogenase (short-subunit alcohol dehydrogenase family)
MGIWMKLAEIFGLQGKVALVTGGARDLGYHMAAALAEAGADLMVTSRTESDARQAALKLGNAFGVRTLGLPLDQTRFDSVQGMAAEAVSWKGQIDVLVNNAGGTPVSGPRDLFERDPEEIRLVVELNLTGMIFCCREIGRHMADRRSGSIVNIGSIAGIVGRDRRMYDQNQMRQQSVDYAAAKAGVIGFTRDLAGFLSPKGVRVNSISPGGFQRVGMEPGFVRDYSAQTPLERMGRDEVDLKGAVLYLASDAAAYVTGHDLVVDGGFTVWK